MILKTYQTKIKILQDLGFYRLLHFQNHNIFQIVTQMSFANYLFICQLWGNSDIGTMSELQGDTIIVDSDSVGQAFGLNILFTSFRGKRWRISCL